MELVAVLAQVRVEADSGGLGAGGFVVSGILTLVFLGIGIWAALDANKYPDATWQATGQNKTLWMVLPIVMGLCCGILVLIPVLIYFLSIKKKLDAAGGGYGTGYGA